MEPQAQASLDNAVRPWELPEPMRWALLVLLVAGLLAVPARAWATSAARAAVEDANVALAAEAPRRDEARAALLRAIAAADDVPATGEAWFLLGQLDEDDFAFARAMDDDRAAVKAAPDTRWAIRGGERADWLRARSEGDFAPLARLERVRRDSAAASDPAAIDALARDLEAFPPGKVKVEARMLVAEANLGRLHRPEAALPQLRAVTEDAHADPLAGRLAEREYVDALVAAGRLDDAAAEARAHKARLDPRFAKQVQRLLVRRGVRVGAYVVLGAFALLALAGIVRAALRGTLGAAFGELRKLGPVALLFVAFIAVAGGVLASKYESGNASPFLWLGAAVLPMVLVARLWSAVGAQTPRARAARALLCGASVLAAAFTLLDTLQPEYLVGFGL